MSQLRILARHLLALPGRIRNFPSLEKLSRSSGKQPVLAFGGVLDHGGLIHGGAVKLLHLRHAFSSSEKEFNLLYLVSSSLPPYAEDLVRRCRKLGVPLVWNQNGVGYPAWAGADTEYYNAPMRRLRAQADFVVYQSVFCRDTAGKFLGPCDVPSEVLLNPVDLGKFHPPAVPIAAEPLKLLTLGTHGYSDRVLSTIRCLKVLQSAGVTAFLTIAGRLGWPGGPEEVRAEVAGLDLGDRVNVLPSFSQDEAAELYRSHHILIHPKYLDPCPTVVIEALASGLPVVGSASGGLPEMVPGNCGELIPVPTVWDRLITPRAEEFATAVQRLIPRLNEASRAARAHAEATYDASMWCSKHGEIFRRVLA